MFLDIDACTRNRTVHIDTRRVRPFESPRGTGRILHCDRQQLRRQFASRRECKKLQSDAFCPS